MIETEPDKIENVVEYLLWMWQAEDLVRAFEFNPLKIDEFVLSQVSEEKGGDLLRDWYHNLTKKMKRQGLEKKGHLEELNQLLLELVYLHNTLLQVLKDEKYVQLFKVAQPHLEEFKKKSNLKVHEVEASMNGMYGLLLLKIQKKEISPATEESLGTFKNLLQHLSLQYKKMKTGELNFTMN